jgi:hypothetical protein
MEVTDFTLNLSAPGRQKLSNFCLKEVSPQPMKNAFSIGLGLADRISCVSCSGTGVGVRGEGEQGDWVC